MMLDKKTANAVLATLGLGKVVAVTAQTGGNNPLFHLTLADGNILLLKGYSTEDGPHKDAYAAAQLGAIALPITRYLAVDSSKSLLAFPFAVTSYLPGISISAFADHLDVKTLYRGMGQLLRATHSVAMPAYGHFGRSGIVNPVASYPELVRDLIEHSFERFAEMGAEASLTKRLRGIVNERFDAIVSYSHGPVFAHDDLHPNNVLAVEDHAGLHLSGLIDFGNAKAGDAVSDLAKCLFCCEHDAPGSTPYILEGYGKIDHPDPDGAIWFYTLLHRVVMWRWLRQRGFIATADTPSDLIDALRVMSV